ncbi:hypothetical protein ACTFIU_009163 [Dictyostelium citrinum]
MSLKRNINEVVKIKPSEINWNDKDQIFLNLYNNYQKLFNLYSTPISIFNSSLLSLNLLIKKDDYSQHPLQFIFCGNENHITMVQVRTLSSEDYNINNSNLYCTHCGSKQQQDIIKHIKICKETNFFKFTDTEFNKLITKVKQTSTVPCCTVCNPSQNSYQDKFSFYGLELIDDTSIIICPT